MKSLITVPIYTRFLSPADYGIMSLISGFTRILAPITSFKIEAGLATYYYGYDHEERKKYLGTIFVSVLIFIFLFQLLFFTIGPQLISFIYPRAEIKYYPIVQLALITVFIGRIGNIGRLLLITIEKGKLLFIRNILKATIGLLLGIYFIAYKNMGLFGSYLAGTISAIISVIFILYLVKDEFFIYWDRKHFLSSLKFGIPMIPHAISGMIFMYSDKIILEKFVPLSAIGLYSIADKLTRLFKTIVNSINNALAPSFMKHSYKSKEKTALLFKDIVTKWAVMISFLFLIIVFFSEEILIILTPPSFHSAYLIIPILLTSYIFRGLYTFSVNPLFFEKKNIPYTNHNCFGGYN